MKFIDIIVFFVLLTIVKRAIVNEASDRLYFRVSCFKKSNRFHNIVRQSREQCRNIDGDYCLLLLLVIHYHLIMSSTNNSLDVIKLNSKKCQLIFRYFALYVSTIACLLFNNYEANKTSIKLCNIKCKMKKLSIIKERDYFLKISSTFTSKIVDSDSFENFL